MRQTKQINQLGTHIADPTLRQARRIEVVPIDALAPDARNPRRHDRQQLARLAESLTAFGFNAPILVDRFNKVIAGHGRLQAAQLCGYSTVPIIRLEHLNEVEARAYMLADNKLSDRSSWDDRALAHHLKKLSEIALDFEIEATGFELPEIDIRIQSLDEPEIGDTADEFDVNRGPAVSSVGDLWSLGSHRLLCASALEKPALARLMNGAKAAAVFTDPPYNVPINGHVVGKGAIKHSEFAMASGEMSDEAFTTFLATSFKNLAAHASPGAVIFSCMDWRHAGAITAAGQSADFELLNLCIWVKSNGGMGSLYRSQHELVFVYRNGRAHHRNNVQLGRFGRNRTNVWHYAGANSFPRKGRQNSLIYHPTSKPIALVADAILDVTKRDDVVLDTFAGAGTTILAAERTGRRGYAIELYPHYVDTAIERWQEMTGKCAKHASGSTFTELRSQRRAA